MALAQHCDIDIANMAGKFSVRTSEEVVLPRLRRLPVQVGNVLSLTKGLLPNRVRTPFYTSDIPRTVRRGGYDLVHLHNPLPALDMMRIARACLATGVPYVVSSHGFVEIADPGSFGALSAAERIAWDLLVDRPLRFVVRHAVRIFALSPNDIPIVENFGFRGRHIDIIPNGVDLPPPRPEPSPDEVMVYSKFGLPFPRDQRRIVCFFLANHTPNKGLPVLLDAFTMLDRPYELIVGGDKRDFVDYEAYLRRCGPNQRIVFTGYLSSAEVTAMFRYSDLFVFPTLADTFPNVVLEAIAHGVPVVATRVGGIPYQVDNGCGVLVESGDAAAIAVAVDALAVHRQRLSEMGRLARVRAEREFSWTRSAAEAYRIYRSIVEESGRWQVRTAHSVS
jgi:glycosyltransferase involved in cell wall biosynthesis